LSAPSGYISPSLTSARLATRSQLRRGLSGGVAPPPGVPFDDLTLIYDVFRSVDGQDIVLIGPQPANLEAWLIETVRAAFPAGTPIRWFVNNRLIRLWVRSPAAVFKLDDPNLVQSRMTVQPNESARFADRRVLFTLSKNNRLEWIVDWASFMASVHGCDAVLLYDNASNLYSCADIAEALRAIPGIEAVTVVDWPYAYGVLGATNFCQPNMLENARRRFLAHAKSVVNADIDELPVTWSGRSIFELAERSTTGYVQGPARFVENATRASPDVRRHRDFVCYLPDRRESPPKWAAVPSRCPEESVWRPHMIEGMASDDEAAADVLFRHFDGLSERRWHPNVELTSASVIDADLAAHMAQIGWLSNEL
jgi:hypothetical protein